MSANQNSNPGHFRRFLRHPITVAMVAILIGATAGFFVFLVSDVTGWRLFLLRGALIGGITGLGMIVYIRRTDRFALSEVTLSVPEFAQIKFAINTEYRRAAWKLFVDTLTRIATQPLPVEEGSLREALSSLYGIFTGTRELLKTIEPSKTPSGVTVEMLAVRMLNHEIRPFLAKWHMRLKKFEDLALQALESDWPDNSECRRELESLRHRVIDYTLAFGELAGIKHPKTFLEPMKDSTR